MSSLTVLEHLLSRQRRKSRIPEAQAIDHAIGPSDDGNGTEFTGRTILKWADKNDVEWHHFDPRKPQQHAYIKSFVDRLRDARRKLGRWRHDDNHVRPHASLGNQTPA